MCADFADLVIATGTPVSVGQPTEPTTLDYANVTFEPEAELIVIGSVNINVSGTFDAGSSGVVLCQDVAEVLTINAKTVAGALTINGTGQANGHVYIYYGSAEPGWSVHSTDQFISVVARQV